MNHRRCERVRREDIARRVEAVDDPAVPPILRGMLPDMGAVGAPPIGAITLHGSAGALRRPGRSARAAGAQPATIVVCAQPILRHRVHRLLRGRPRRAGQSSRRARRDDQCEGRTVSEVGASIGRAVVAAGEAQRRRDGHEPALRGQVVGARRGRGTRGPRRPYAARRDVPRLGQSAGRRAGRRRLSVRLRLS